MIWTIMEIRRTRHTAVLIITAIFTAILALVIAVQIPSVQSKLCGNLLEKVNGKINGKFSFSHLSFLPFNTIIVKDFSLTDSNPDTCSFFPPQDTVFYAKTVIATFSLKSLRSTPVRLKKAKVIGGYYFLTNSQGKKPNISRVLNGKGEPQPMSNIGKVLIIDRIDVKDFSYKMTNTAEGPRERWEAVDFNDLDVYVNNCCASDFSVMDGHIKGCVTDFSFKEKSGYEAIRMSGDVDISYGNTVIENLHLLDTWSDLYLERYAMRYENHQSFTDFIDSVKFDCVFQPSSLDMRSIAAFTPAVKQFKHKMNLGSGTMYGPINGFKLENLSLKENSGLSANINVEIKNVCDIHNSSYILKKSTVTTTFSSFKLFAEKFGISIPILPVAASIPMKFELSGNGPINRIDAILKISSQAGELSADVLIADVLKKNMSIGGTVDTRNLDISKFMDKKGLPNECTMHASLSTTIGKESLNRLSIDTLNISRLKFKDYNYSGISGKGVFEDGLFDGRIISSDPNMNFLFQGICNLSKNSGNALYQFYFNLGYADLFKTGLDSRGKSAASCQVRANYMAGKGKKLHGDIKISDIVLENQNGKHRLGSIVLNSTDHRSILSSSFIDGEMENNRIDLSIKESSDILDFLTPGLYIAKGSQISLKGKPDSVSISLTSSRLALGKNYMKDVSVTLSRFSDSLGASLKGRETGLGKIKIDSTGLGLTSIRSNDNSFNINTVPGSFISLEGKDWKTDQSDLFLSKDSLHVGSFRLYNGKSILSILGGLSSRSADSLRVIIKDLDLKDFSSIVPGNIKALCEGNALFISDGISSRPRILCSLNLSDASVSGIDAGKISIGSYWNDEDKKFELSLKDSLDGKIPLNAKASYAPSSRQIAAKISFDDTDISYAKGFATNIFSDMRGKLSGDIYAVGDIGSPSVYSNNFSLDSIILKPSITNVPYLIDGKVKIDDNGIDLGEVSISDNNYGIARLKGGVSFRKLKNIRLSTELDFENMEVFASTPASSIPVYGNVSASGRIDVRGALDSLKLNVDASTSGYGNIHIPIHAMGGSDNSSILSYKKDESKVDPYDEFRKRQDKSRQKKKSAISVNVRARVNPELNCTLEIDKNSTSVISGNGNGDIKVKVDGGKVDFMGDYTLTGGKFHFSALGIIGRDFSIVDGSQIKFGGDIMESTLDINAKYTTKASLSSLIADTTTSSTVRAVECGINLSDKLRNPKFKFSVNVPDLDPSTASYVKSALCTEDKVQKQFLSLLVANSFIPDDQTSGIVNNSEILYSNVSQMMADQLNNIFQRLEIPLDLGFKYKPNEKGTDIFDVAVGAQLFKGRVSINGSVGNKNYAVQGNDVSGDLDIGIKLDRNGTYRLRLFSHSADIYSNYLDYSQRNGAGIGYRKEFNRLREFLGNLFRSKKKENPQKSGEERPDKRKTIIINGQD